MEIPICQHVEMSFRDLAGRKKKKKKRLLNIIDPEFSPADASREAAPPACICILSSVEGTVGARH